MPRSSALALSFARTVSSASKVSVTVPSSGEVPLRAETKVLVVAVERWDEPESLRFIVGGWRDPDETGRVEERELDGGGGSAGADSPGAMDEPRLSDHHLRLPVELTDATDCGRSRGASAEDGMREGDVEKAERPSATGMRGVEGSEGGRAGKSGEVGSEEGGGAERTASACRSTSTCFLSSTTSTRKRATSSSDLARSRRSSAT